MESTSRAIRIRSYDGSDEVEVAVAEPTTVERAIPSWVDELQLISRDAEGNPVEWTLQDSHGNMIPPSVDVADLRTEEPYTLAPDLTPA
jgi:hypothetical protein